MDKAGGSVLNSAVGPYLVGKELTLTCKVTGGQLNGARTTKAIMTDDQLSLEHQEAREIQVNSVNYL